ncbi:Mpv17-like protein 2 [Frankliniella fusca]|uniref:Mpv17-like protein 2 n=1 Tax=Frankliniella fusca TaxID=407009 RepID=A0AAE1HBW0_9NEOP|nr:Mpv17-like protein 2 [Frankliniella fusca]KAK3916651.1 Mpv17-like protein 2 [Frankliniella fusca]KAK3917896.1 Mpv17-like protein 2 [Frankliniella fusca]
MTSLLCPARFTVLTHLVKSKCRRVVHQMFHKYLLYTNVAISVSLSGVGDTLEQHYEILSNQKEEWEKSRTVRMSISGMTVGVICHNWYKFLDSKFPGRTIKIVAQKVMIDQIICSPLCIATFFITLGILEKATWAETKKEIKDKAWRLYAAEWVVWPPAQVLNFYILPLRYRVLYDNTISLGYDVYTSYVKHDNESESDSDKVLKAKLEEQEEDDEQGREAGKT